MKRILIIEDDRDIVELVRYNLANEGFQVSAASIEDLVKHAHASAAPSGGIPDSADRTDGPSAPPSAPLPG